VQRAARRDLGQHDRRALYGARSIAGCFLFITLIQCFDLPP
jgi:hypothetical protein